MKKVLWSVVAIVVGVPLLGVLGLFVAGKRDGAGRNGAAVVVDRPASTIWPYLTRPDQLKKWLGGLEELTPTGGPQDALANGAKAKLKVRATPDEPAIEVDQVVTAVEPPRRLAFRLTAMQDGMGFVESAEYRLDEKDGRTLVSFFASSEYQGAMARLFEPLITSAAQNKLESDLRALKRVVEAESSGAPAPLTASASSAVKSPVESGGGHAAPMDPPVQPVVAAGAHAVIDAGAEAPQEQSQEAKANAQAGGPPESDSNAAPAAPQPETDANEPAAEDSAAPGLKGRSGSDADAPAEGDPASARPSDPQLAE